MRKILASLARRLLFAAGISIIVVAIALGTFRLLLAQLPAYQAELKTWVDDSLGLTLGFDRLDARLGLRGPELTFSEVTVAAAGSSRPFLVADRAAIVIDPWTALTERELRLSRLLVDGTQLTVERGADGALHLQGAPVGEARMDLALTLPPEVEVALRDSGVVYVDAEREVEWAFTNVTLGLRRSETLLQVDIAADPPPALGSRIELAAQQALGGDAGTNREWRVFGGLVDADVATLSAALPPAAFAPGRGLGDVSMWLEWGEAGLMRGMIDADLKGVEWAASAGPQLSGYEQLAVSAEWQRLDDGWRVLVDELDVSRNGREWPEGGTSLLEVRADALTLRSDFLRLHDLMPLVAALPQTRATLRWREIDPRGDIRDADVELQRDADGRWHYSVASVLDGVGTEPWGEWPGFDGLSGQLRADPGSGRAELDTTGASLDWPSLFRAPLDIEELAGVIVWREGFDAVRIVSDDLVLRSSDIATRSNMELTLPLDGSSPQLDLELTVGGFPAAAAKRWLPVHVMPARAVAWLDDAIQGGYIGGISAELVGPLRAFPFDGGEGEFNATLDVEDGVLEFVDGWPAAEDLDGRVVFRNQGFVARGSGRVLGNVSDDVVVGIEDLRDAVLTVQAGTRGRLDDVLGFLKASPLIARYLGPGYSRVEAPDGAGNVSLDLALPLGDMTDYTLAASLDISGGELAVEGFGPHATSLDGTLTIADGIVSGRDISGVFLDGPVSVSVGPPEADGYRARLDVVGEVTADAVARALALPVEQHVAGQTRWRGSLLIPSRVGDPEAAGAPLRIGVTSTLSGVAMSFPAPFEKNPAEATTLQIDFTIGAGGLDVDGHLGASRRFAFGFAADADDEITLRHGTLHFGGAPPVAARSGRLAVTGSLPALHFDEWTALVRSMTERTGGIGTGRRLSIEGFDADLEIADMSGLGQQLGGGRLSVSRAEEAWLIDVDTMPVAGSISVPTRLAGRPAIVADMTRLHIEPGDGTGPGLAALDPRDLPGLSLQAESFAFGQRRLGNFSADVRADSVGLRLVSFEASGSAFTVEGSGGWFDGPNGPTTRLAFSLAATDVAAALEQLALDPIVEGDSAEITASVYWPGAPSADWSRHLGGDLALRLGTGSLLDIDPGAGRVVGLMSISALPRRLALDFRDVFNKGFVFDEIAGDFAIVDGNAYTDNLKVTGPVAEIGVAGRIGLRDRDYSQQAVVTAEPGNMLPTVGGLIGGPGVGAALLIFTRIFKEPLKGIGRASYCVTGSWEQPVVERLSAEQLEQGRICAELPADGDTQAAREPPDVGRRASR